jgi:hypothetical protein
MRTRRNCLAALLILLFLFTGFARIDSANLWAQAEIPFATVETEEVQPEETPAPDEPATQSDVESGGMMGGYGGMGGGLQYPMRPMTQEEADEANNTHQGYLQRYLDRIDPLMDKQIQIHSTMADLLAPPEAFEETIRRLSEEIINIEVETSGLEARVEATHNAIARLAAEAEEQIKNDVNIAYAEAALAVAQHQLQRVNETEAASPGSISEFEIHKFELEAQRSELQLTQSIQELRGGFGAAETMNQQLMEIAIQQAELQAKERTIRERLDRAKDLIPLLQDYKLNAQLIDAIVKQYTDMSGQFTPVRAGDPTTDYDAEPIPMEEGYYGGMGGMMGGMGGMGIGGNW